MRTVGIRLVAVAVAARRRGQSSASASFLLVFALFVGSYPAIQFDHRHYFHLEFFTWWSLGFIVQCVATASQRVWRERRIDVRRVLAGSGRMAALAIGAWLVLAVPLKALRVYQASRVTGLLHAYQAAPKIELGRPLAPSGSLALVAPPIPRASAGLIEVDVDAARCDRPVPVVFRYDSRNPAADFTRTITVPKTTGGGTTRVFVAVYPNFMGIELPGPSDCVTGAYRLTDTDAFPLLIDATLPPDWERLPLYQRLARWTPW